MPFAKNDLNAKYNKYIVHPCFISPFYFVEKKQERNCQKYKCGGCNIVMEIADYKQKQRI